MGRVYPDFGNDDSAPPPPAGPHYSVKDQPIPPPATYQAPGRRRGRGPCCCLFAWLCSVLVMFAIVIGIAVLVFWLLVQPRAPTYEVEKVTVSGLQSSNTNSTILNTSVAVYVMARNPNKHIGFYYDNIWVTAETQGLTIGQGNLPPFYQGHKTTSYINGTLSSLVPVNSDTLTQLPTTKTANNVPIYAKVDLKTRVKIGSWNSKKITVKIHCNINVDMTKSESQLISNSCKVKR